MPVYVDNMRAKFRGMIMCHMIADTIEELHGMADLLGLQRKWFQGDHYDISLTKRADALAYGAKAITWKQCGFMANNVRNGWPMGTPETAEDIARERRNKLDDDIPF